MTGGIEQNQTMGNALSQKLGLEMMIKVGTGVLLTRLWTLDHSAPLTRFSGTL
jgi:hypothetical protein